LLYSLACSFSRLFVKAFERDSPKRTCPAWGDKMAAPYRGNFGEGVTWTLIIVSGFVIQGLAIWLAHPYEKALGNWMALISFGPILLIAAVAIAVDVRKRRARMDSMGPLLESMGMVFERTPTIPILDHLRPQLADVCTTLSLPDGIGRAQWLAYHEHFLVFEHHYVTGVGKTPRETIHTVVAWPANAQEPAGAALGTSMPLYLLRTHAKPRKSRREKEEDGLSIGDPDFDGVWYLHGDLSTAKRFLSPAVRELLMSSPVGEKWLLGYGWAVVAFPKGIDQQNLALFIAHAHRVLSAVR
jgi:hypothetical protein